MAGADGSTTGTASPVTELDARFGEDGAEAMPWAEALGLLERAELSWLSTVARSGRPHVTPILTVVVDGTVRFSTGPPSRRRRTWSRRPEVAVTTGVNVLLRRDRRGHRRAPRCGSVDEAELRGRGRRVRGQVRAR